MRPAIRWQVVCLLMRALPDWVWDVGEAEWQEGLAALEAYVAEHGDARVPVSYKTAEGFRLAGWVRNRRTNYKQGQLSAERIGALEALPDWVWDASG